jgi:hypothetical protein
VNTRGSRPARDRRRPGRSSWVGMVAVVAALSLAAALGWVFEHPDEPSIDGRVVGPAGQPVANASVRTPDGRVTHTGGTTGLRPG